MRRPRLVYVVTHPASADILLRGQLAFMREHGFDVTVIASPGAELERVRAREGVETREAAMARAPDPRRDLRSLAGVIHALRAVSPDIVNAGTPKGGLLGMMAARALGVPIRIYLLRGLRLETERGALRRILATTERIASACAHEVVGVSQSLVRVAVEGRFVPHEKAMVVGAGSSNGVDVDRFRRDEALRREGQERLAAFGVAPTDRLVAFVGRLVADKGIGELLDAFERVRAAVPDTKLLLLGGNLSDEVRNDALMRRVGDAAGVIATGTIADLAPYYARIDVLAFPSYREGFPNVPLEAAAAEVPVVGFRSTGVIDAVVHGETGELVAQRDVEGLVRGIVGYLRDPDRARAHGRAGRERAVRLFSRRVVWDAWLEHYRSRLAARGLPLPRG